MEKWLWKQEVEQTLKKRGFNLLPLTFPLPLHWSSLCFPGFRGITGQWALSVNRSHDTARALS